MYLITKPKVNRVIKEFVKKVEQNKDGIYYPTVPEEYREFMEQFLNRFYHSFITLFEDKNCGTEIFVNRLMLIDAVRFDDKDQNLMPLKIAFDDMKETCKGNLDGGLLMPDYKHGVILLDMDFKLSKAEAMHTLIHELLHAMAMILILEKGNKLYKSGINRNGKAFNRINEGIVEYIAQLMWAKMFPYKPCPGIGRYALEVQAAQMIMEQFDSVEQFIEDYLIGGIILEAEMKSIKNADGNSMFDFLKSFNNKDLTSVKVQRKFINEIKNYKVDAINKN